MLMPNRHNSTEAYRYGFNGMEKDDEVKNDAGTHLDFGARAYDSRLGRFMSIDRQTSKYTSLTPYNFVANNPITNIDPNGEEIVYASNVDLSAQKAAIEKLRKENVMFNMIYEFLDALDYPIYIIGFEDRMKGVAKGYAQLIMEDDDEGLDGNYMRMAFDTDIATDLTYVEEFLHSVQHHFYERDRPGQELEAEVKVARVVLLGWTDPLPENTDNETPDKTSTSAVNASVSFGSIYSSGTTEGAELGEKYLSNNNGSNREIGTEGGVLNDEYSDYLQIFSMLENGDKYYGGTQRDLSPDVLNYFILRRAAINNIPMQKIKKREPKEVPVNKPVPKYDR